MNHLTHEPLRPIQCQQHVTSKTKFHQKQEQSSSTNLVETDKKKEKSILRKECLDPTRKEKKKLNKNLEFPRHTPQDGPSNPNPKSYDHLALH